MFYCSRGIDLFTKINCALENDIFNAVNFTDSKQHGININFHSWPFGLTCDFVHTHTQLP